MIVVCSTHQYLSNYYYLSIYYSIFKVGTIEESVLMMEIHWNVTNLRFVPTKDLPQQTFVLFVQGPPTVLGWGTIVHTAQNNTQ